MNTLHKMVVEPTAEPLDRCRSTALDLLDATGTAADTW